MTNDKYADLRGDELDAALKDAGDPDTSEGGANQDGSWSADQKRDYLRSRDDAADADTGPDVDPDELDTHGLSDDQQAQAFALPVPRLYRDELDRAHAENDVDQIALLTREINQARLDQHARATSAA